MFAYFVKSRTTTKRHRPFDIFALRETALPPGFLSAARGSRKSIKEKCNFVSEVVHRVLLKSAVGRNRKIHAFPLVPSSQRECSSPEN